LGFGTGDLGLGVWDWRVWKGLSWGFGVSYLFDDEFEHDLCLWAQVVYLRKLGFVQAVVRGEDLEEAVWAFIEGHWSVWVG
jgi:hypothetical protein